MPENTEIKVVAVKIITGEKERLTGFKQAELYAGFSYVLYDIFGLTEEEIPRILSIDFMKTYDIFRYYSLIEVPDIYSKVKFRYILSKLCPNVVKFNFTDETWERYLLNLRNNDKQTFWQEFHDMPLTFSCVKRVLLTVYDADDISDFFMLTKEQEESVYETLKAFGLYDFYENFFFCIPDLIFFSLTEEEQKKYFRKYLKARIMYPGADMVMKIAEYNEKKIKCLPK